MGAIAATSAFATVVGLLSDFVSQRKQAKAEDYQEFLGWLSEHRHEEIVQLLGQQSTSVISIKALLTQDRNDLQSRLDALDRTLAAFAGAIDGLASVAEAVYPGGTLSEQAMSILQQFQQTNASRLLPKKFQEGMVAIFMDGKGGQAAFTEQRFIEDDFGMLVELGLLRLDHNSKGDRVYVYTRRADEFVRLRSGGAK